jgi:hypothetical protein
VQYANDPGLCRRMSLPSSFSRPQWGRGFSFPDLGLNHRTVLALLIFAYAALQTLQISRHAPWLDEYQAWLIAIEAPTLRDVLRNIRFEGHPPVWHIMLWCVQRFSHDVGAMQVLQALISFACGAIILTQAPFPVWLRVLVALNYFVLFEYGVIARPYSVAMLLMFTALVFWQRPVAWVALAAIPLMSFHSALLAGVLAVDRLFNHPAEARQEKLGGLALFCVANLLALYFEWPDPQTVPALSNAPDVGYFARTLLFVWSSGALLVPMSSLGGWTFDLDSPALNSSFIFGAISAGCLLPFLLWQATRGDRWRRLLVFGLFGLLGLFWIGVYPTRIRHSGILILLLIALAWIDAQRGAQLRPIFVALSIWMALMGGAVGVMGLLQPFSYDNAVARLVQQVVPPGAAIVTEPPIQSIAVYRREPTYSLRSACRESFVRWNFSELLSVSDKDVDARLMAVLKQAGGRVYMVGWYDPRAERPSKIEPAFIGPLQLTTALKVGMLTFSGLDVKVLGTWPSDRYGFPRYLFQIDLPGSPQPVVSEASRLPICPG